MISFLLNLNIRLLSRHYFTFFLRNFLLSLHLHPYQCRSFWLHVPSDYVECTLHGVHGATIYAVVFVLVCMSRSFLSVRQNFFNIKPIKNTLLVARAHECQHLLPISKIIYGKWERKRETKNNSADSRVRKRHRNDFYCSCRLGGWPIYTCFVFYANVV